MMKKMKMVFMEIWRNFFGVKEDDDVMKKIFLELWILGISLY